MEKDISRELKMIGQGNTAEIYQYGEKSILKLFRKSMPLTPIENEYRIAKIVQEQLECVPKAMDIIQLKGRTGIVYEQINGVDMTQLLIERLSDLDYYSKMLASIHASMHQKHIDVHYSVKDKLRTDIRWCNGLSDQEKKKLYRYIDTLPEKQQICHFDFHPGNVMISGTKPYVIDWMTACTGDANADVARTLLLMNMGELMNISSEEQVKFRRVMNNIGEEYLKEYQAQTGAVKEEIDAWTLPVAAARLSEWLTDHEREKLVLLVKEKLNSFSM